MCEVMIKFLWLIFGRLRRCNIFVDAARSETATKILYIKYSLANPYLKNGGFSAKVTV